MPEQQSPEESSKSEAASSDELSFEKADFEGEDGDSFLCAACNIPIRDSYFRAGDAVVCSSCRWAAEEEAGQRRPGGPGRFGKAFLYGLGAAAAGTLVYFLVLWITGYEVGLIAILVGWMVGQAVFVGSERTGGRRFQLMAVALTYFSICASYAPLIVQEMLKVEDAEELPADAVVRIPVEGEEASPPTEQEIAQARPMPDNPEEIVPGEVYRLDAGPADDGEVTVVNGALAVVLILAFSMAAPFLAGFENILGLLIIGFGLWEAWKLAGARELAFEGPFAVGD